ncbi:unnamed protein product [Nezara viridula]|uniref:Uncharacterized protein n=1 Tax=Nezara viridula TaxID=85310 RepID=A0A9P0HHK5_NEZVI|nr:unnamed protein product [Nezara viridula]
MESSELLEQEEAFHKLNAEIELRTRQLMKNVEAVISKQSPRHWAPDPGENYSLSNRTQKRNGLSPDFINGNSKYFSEENDFHELLDQNGHKVSRQCQLRGSRKSVYNQGKGQNKKDLSDHGLLPSSAKGMSAESLVRLLKAKGKLLQEELEQVKRELQNKNDELKKIHLDIKNLEDEKQKFLSDSATLRDKVKKLEVNLASQTEKLQMRDSENIILKKEIEILKQDIKRLNLCIAGNEAKLNKSREETEKFKLLLKQSESNEKEARDKCRTKNDDMVVMVRKLEKQKSELLGSIKKQMILIENLKKQKDIAETEKGLNFTEKEFLKMLEMRNDHKMKKEDE